jgi:hypothetical protein
MNQFINILLIGLAIQLMPQISVSAETREDKGLAIAMEADRRDTGFKD